MACCHRKARRSLKQVRTEFGPRHRTVVIRVLPVLCMAAAFTSEQLEEKMPIR